MREMKLFEQVIAGEITAAESGIPFDMLKAYADSRRNGNQLMDFHEVIWNREIAPISAALRTFGITEFTISTTFSSLIETLALFEKLGWKMSGIVTVNAPYYTFMGDEWEQIPAIKMVHVEA